MVRVNPGVINLRMYVGTRGTLPGNSDDRYQT